MAHQRGSAQVNPPPSIAQTRADSLLDQINALMLNQPDSAYLLAESLRDSALKNHWPHLVAEAWMALGNASYYMGQMGKSVYFSGKALQQFEAIHDSVGMIRSTNALAGFYQDEGQWEQALQLRRKTLGWVRQLGLTYRIPGILSTIGQLQGSLGRPDSAFLYFRTALQLFEADQIRGISAAWSSLADLHQGLGRPDSALICLQQALALYPPHERIYATVALQLKLGDAYLELVNTTEAIAWCTKSLNNSRLIKALELESRACQCLSKAHEAAGNPAQALVFLKKHQILNDSLNLAEIGQQLNRLAFERKMERDSLLYLAQEREAALRFQHQINREKWAKQRLLGAGILCLIVAIGFYNRARFQRQSKLRILKEQERSEKLLLNILPADVAQELKDRGQVQAKHHHCVAVLFSDFCDFSTIANQTTPEDLVEELHTCFQAFDAMAREGGIEKIKTIGDAYMAVAGLGAPMPDLADRALRLGQHMQAFMEKRFAQPNPDQKPRFRMRIGIHCGPVVSGVVGQQKFQFDVWGDVVNTAARLETTSEPGKVNISEAVLHQVVNPEEWTFEARGTLAMKGLQPIPMFFVHPSLPRRDNKNGAAVSAPSPF
jgi:class 3 adenylate cyclase